MKITWEVDDGYCGGRRPQTTEVDDDELELCENDEERETLIEEAIGHDFDQLISWHEIEREETQ